MLLYITRYFMLLETLMKSVRLSYPPLLFKIWSRHMLWRNQVIFSAKKNNFRLQYRFLLVQRKFLPEYIAKQHYLSVIQEIAVILLLNHLLTKQPKHDRIYMTLTIYIYIYIYMHRPNWVFKRKFQGKPLRRNLSK